MKALLLPLFYSGFILTLLVAPETSLAVVVTQNATAPTENILRAATDDTRGEAPWNGFGSVETAKSGWRDLGQMFQSTSAGTLTAFTYKLSGYETQALGAAFTVQIYASPTAALFTPETLVSEQTGFLPTALEAGNYISFKLDETVDLEAHLFYTVYLHFDTPGDKTTPGKGSRRLLKFATANYTASENPLGLGCYAWFRENPFGTAAVGNYMLTSYFEGTAANSEPQSVALVIGAAGIFWIGLKLTHTSGTV